MIPKIIHYCWFGNNTKPHLAIRCIESWKKYLPDYEIIEWNESNFDVNMIPYTAEAYRLKKYAFVSDYVRFYVLNQYGGLYFDTDVEIIRNMDDIIARGPFMGFEAGDLSVCDERLMIAPGLGLGANPGLGLYKKMLDSYAQKHYVTLTGKPSETVVYAITSVLRENKTYNIDDGIFRNGDIFLYSPEYFCPKNYFTGELRITEKTVSIHHYNASWVESDRTLFSKIHNRIINIWTRITCMFFVPRYYRIMHQNVKF